MNHHGIIVHQDPEPFFLTLYPQRLDLDFGQLFFDLLGQGRHLALGAAGAEDEIVREGTKVFYLKEHWLQGLVIHQGFEGQLRQSFWGERS